MPAAITRGEKKPEELGVTAPDDRTVLIRLATPAPYLLGLLSQPGTFPVHGPSLAAHGAEYARPGKLVSNGAFVLADWVIGSHVVLRRNPHYWNNAATKLEEVHFVHIADAGTELRQYRAGQLDFTYVVPAPQFQWIKQNLPDELHVAPQLSVYYYGFNLTRPPFKDNPKLRRALSMAIDRDKLTTAVTGVGEAPAYGWVPRGVWNYTPQQFDYAEQAVCRTPGRGPPPVRRGRVFRRQAVAGRAALQLGRPAQPAGRRGRGHVEGRRSASRRRSTPRSSAPCCRASRPARTRRCSGRAGSAISTTPTPSPSCCRSNFGINLSGYSNPRYDALLADAVKQADPARRRALLEEAERVMLADHPVLPLYFYVNKHLVKPWVRGWTDNVMNVVYSKDLWLEPPTP